jgi:PAS domain S-box-containing protein
MTATPDSRPEIKIYDEILNAWQIEANILANLLEVPFLAMTRYAPPFLEIICANQSDKIPYSSGTCLPCKNSYCEVIIDSGEALCVPDATKNDWWKNNPALKEGLVAYLGYPVFASDGKIFGALFIMDSKPNSFSDESRKLLQRFKEQIESNLGSLSEPSKIRNSTDEMKNACRTLSTLTGNLPGIVYRCANDPDWTMEYINGDCLNLTGYANEDIERNRKLAYADLIHPDDQDQVWENVQKGLQQKESFYLEYRIISAKGQTKWVCEHGCGIFSERGELQALEGYITEITEQKNATKELEKHKNHIEQLVWKRTQDLERSNQLLKISIDNFKRSNHDLENFAFLASHDLQEPLRKIKTFSSYIQNHSENLDEKCKTYFNRMIKASERMQSYMDDLLQLSQVTNPAQHRHKTDLNKVMKDILVDLEDQITTTRAQIHIEKLPVIRADAVQMKQLFQNILSNSLKFHKKEVAPEITVRSLHSINNDREIIIEDNGIGISHENRERIFKPFERLHGRGEYEGTGIGLALCKKIVSINGWKIKIEGVPGSGTRVLITLPSDPTNNQSQ